MSDVEYRSLNILLLGLALLAAWLLLQLVLHPLRHVPGPYGAFASNIWLARQVKGGKLLRLGKTIHRQYGPVVRVGRNEVWLNSAEAFKIIYGPSHGFEKSDFYLATALLKPTFRWPWTFTYPDTLDLLAERDMNRYRLQRRLIGQVYQTKNMIKYEAAMDQVLDQAVTRLRLLDGAVVNLHEWMHIITVECLGALCLSWSPKYLKDMSDGGSGIHGYNGWARKTIFGLFPLAVVAENASKTLGRLFSTLWGLNYRTPSRTFEPFFPAVGKKAYKRIKTALGPNFRGTLEPDLTTDLIHLHQEKPDFTQHYLRRMAITNFGAGHETMSSALVSIISMLATHPDVLHRAQRELKYSGTLVSFEDITQCRYLQAVIKESQRLYPVIGMALPRTVPSTGLHIHNYYIPPGTTVGCNPVSLHRNPEIFGPDAEKFNPDRWFSDETQVKRMDRYNLTWGGGARTCPGRHMAQFLVSKIVATLVQEFEMEVDMPPDEEITYYFMAIITGAKVRFRPRTGSGE